MNILEREGLLSHKNPLPPNAFIFYVISLSLGNTHTNQQQVCAMSEWQAIHKNPNTNALDFLKNYKAKTRQLSELSKTEQKHLEKLNVIIDKPRRGKNVQNRQLATWLTEEEYEDFESELESQHPLKN